MHFVSKILLIFLALVVLIGMVWLFPKKMKLLNRVGLDKTNADLINLARSGDKEAIDLYRKSKVLLIIAVLIGLCFSVSKPFLN